MPPPTSSTVAPSIPRPRRNSTARHASRFSPRLRYARRSFRACRSSNISSYAPEEQQFTSGGYASGMRASSAAPSASRTGAISTRSSTSWKKPRTISRSASARERPRAIR